MVKSFLVKMLSVRPLVTIASSPHTPAYILDFLWRAGYRNPFNGGWVPTLHPYILANPNIDLSKYEDVTRESLVAAKVKNPVATVAHLDSILDTVERWDVSGMRAIILSAVVQHSNATPEIIARARYFKTYV